MELRETEMIRDRKTDPNVPFDMERIGGQPANGFYWWRGLLHRIVDGQTEYFSEEWKPCGGHQDGTPANINQIQEEIQTWSTTLRRRQFAR